ncbi:MAG: hypothetical protein U0271_34145 [Polyangiaceae bacterium]
MNTDSVVTSDPTAIADATASAIERATRERDEAIAALGRARAAMQRVDRELLGAVGLSTELRRELGLLRVVLAQGGAR